MGPQPTTGEAGEEYRASPDRALRDLKERIRQEAPLRWADQTNDGGPDMRGEPVATEPQEALKTGTSSGRREATRRRSPEYERRDTIADRGYGITEYLEKWELHASRSQGSEEEIIENFLFNVDPSLGREVKEARPKDGKWTTYKKNLVELYKLEDNKYSIQDLETMTQDEDESVRAFGMRFQKISDVLMRKGKISEVERCTIFIGHLSKDRDRRDRELFARARRPDDYPRSPRYEADRGRGDSRGRWETDHDRRDGYRDDRYERSDRDGYRDDRYERSDRDGYRDNRYERSGRDGYRGGRYEEEIGIANDEMGRADGLSAGEMRESSATSRGGGTTEGTDAMSHEGDMTRGTAEMICEGGMSKEGLEETAATMRAVGMREGDMASHQNHIRSRLTLRQPGVRSLEAQTTDHLLPGTHASTVEEKIISRGIARTSNRQ
ncbi:hypothetical protein CBR_g39211 [Chara braunii]|uniref:Retrotransposon gag domain-containing protein n=1 Tax=Chara braunii TaxID=69332 RepID=A0A388LR78_CHABU|nr:hypothetical protein CBR_g39211 [Chara braunii]|eukprot:GBG84836.1 hypothetical protein CBR_g39211 [Chara braunii]